RFATGSRNSDSTSPPRHSGESRAGAGNSPGSIGATAVPVRRSAGNLNECARAPRHTCCSNGFPSGAHTMVSRDQIETVLGRIRPLMQADGGDIVLVDVRGNNAHVRLTGMCAGCPSAHMTLYMGVEMALRDEIKEFEELVVV